jgi:hypothetical protein
LPRHRPRKEGPRRLRRWIAALSTLAVTMGGVYVAATLGPALAAPGTDPTEARVAEWAREQGLGFLVTAAEQVAYQANKPTEGGALAGGIPTVTAAAAQIPAAAGAAQDPFDALTAPIPSRTQPALPGEGAWQSLLTLNGDVVARVAFVRPDATHTSYSVGVVVLDTHELRFALHQGTNVPGGAQVAPTSLTATERTNILATFNSGFQMKDAHGGYWQNGVAVHPLVKGAASMIFGKDGSLAVKSWPGGNPGPNVAAVRQNLVLLVDQGRVSPLVHTANAAQETKVWGNTVGNKAYVWRSAVGTRADGSVVFVVGPALNVDTLASLMADAGAVQAMELDINPLWTNFLWYTQPGPSPHKLTPDEVPDPKRYLVTSTRDFVAVLPR